MSINITATTENTMTNVRMAKELAHKLSGAIKSGLYTIDEMAWSFELQAWLPKILADEADNGCLIEEAYNWDIAKFQVSRMIELIGHASITDEAFAKELEKTHLVHQCRKVTEDDVIEWYEIFCETGKYLGFEDKFPELIVNRFIIDETIDSEPDDDKWEYDDGTYEWCHDGNTIKGYFSTLENTGSIFIEGKIDEGDYVYNQKFLDFPQFSSIIEDFETHTDEYLIQDGILFHALEKMPMDKTSKDGFHLIHATGWEYWNKELQSWVTEYDDEEPWE